MLIYVLRWQPSWISDQHKKQKHCRGPSNDYSWGVWFQLSKCFQRRSVLKHFSYRVQCETNFCPSRHFEFHIGTKNIKLVEDHPMIIHVQFGLNHICSFWEKGIWTFSHRVQCYSVSFGGGHLGFTIGIKIKHFAEDLPMIIPEQFGFNCSSGFREEAFWNIFPIGSNVKLSPAVAAILNFIPEQKT